MAYLLISTIFFILGRKELAREVVALVVVKDVQHSNWIQQNTARRGCIKVKYVARYIQKHYQQST